MHICISMATVIINCTYSPSFEGLDGRILGVGDIKGIVFLLGGQGKTHLDIKRTAGHQGRWQKTAGR